MRERDCDKNKMADGEPAVSQDLVAGLAGFQPALPVRAARRAVVAGPTRAWRGAKASSINDVAAACEGRRWSSQASVSETGVVRVVGSLAVVESLFVE